jgi:hypothetical protein
MSKDLGPPNKQPKHLIIAFQCVHRSSPNHIQGFQALNPTVESTRSGSGKWGRSMKCGRWASFGSVAFLLLLFGLRRTKRISTECSMLSGEICTQIQGVDLEERQKRRGAFSAMGLTRGTAWHCGIAETAFSPGWWTDGNFPVRPVSRDILEDLSSDSLTLRSMLQ